ncbi:zinc finger CW-type PWWP domain protein 1 [Discoglossus pictus]
MDIPKQKQKKRKVVSPAVKNNPGSLTDAQYEEIFAVVLGKSTQEETSAMTEPGKNSDVSSSIASGNTSSPSKCVKKSEVTQAKSDSLLDTAPGICQSVQGCHQEKARAKPNKMSLKRKPKHGDGKSEKQEQKRIRKGNPKKIMEGVTEIIDQEDGKVGTAQPRQCVAWIQCSQESCMKWRRLHGGIDPLLLPDDWSCDQNTDAAYNSCVIPEDTWSGCENEIIYAAFIPGSIVWAKQFGHPWWPAMVENDPDVAEYFIFENEIDQLPSKYHVTFLGDTAYRAWISSSLLRSFQGNTAESVGVNNVKDREIRQKLGMSIKMACSALQMDIQTRICMFGFSGRYKAGIEDFTLNGVDGPDDFWEIKKPTEKEYQKKKGHGLKPRRKKPELLPNTDDDVLDGEAAFTVVVSDVIVLGLHCTSVEGDAVGFRLALLGLRSRNL